MSPRRLLVLVVLVVLVAGLGIAIRSGNPLAGRPLFVEFGGAVAAAIDADPGSAVALRTIADTPQAHWLNGGPGTEAETDAYVAAAAAAAATPVLVLYALPDRDCGGGKSAGGLADAAAYRAFVAEVRAGIAGRPAVVVIEPDALADAACLPAATRTTRLNILHETIGAFAADPATTAYLDAGHSRWLSAIAISTLLHQVGINRIRGVSLNVSNFFGTAQERAYGERIAALTGAHYVIDTSRNGAGPPPVSTDSQDNWCNPPGRALGRRPTIATSPTRGHLDALLWIKRPGESDGSCHPADPTSGLWYNAYALALIENARSRS